MSTPNLQKAVQDAAKIVSALVNGGNLIGEAMGLINPAIDLKNTDFSAAAAELKNLAPADLAALQIAFASALSVNDATKQAAILQGEDYLFQAIDLVSQAATLVEQGIALEKSIQALLGL